MTAVLIAFASIVAVWWFGTGCVLYLQQRLVPRDRRAAAWLVCCGLAAFALHTVSSLSLDALAPYLAFVAAVSLWGVLELAHFLGFVTGTHARHCPPDLRGWSRFRLAVGTSLYHELSIVAAAALLWLVSGDAANPTGVYAFTVLWLMRWSAKLNLFLGVPNFSTEWFPARLAFLTTYMRRARVSALFPVSLCLATIALIAMAYEAATLTAPHSTILLLPAILLALAIVEHLFMLVPVPDNRLWDRLFGLHSAETGTPIERPRERKTIERARTPGHSVDLTPSRLGSS